MGGEGEGAAEGRKEVAEGDVGAIPKGGFRKDDVATETLFTRLGIIILSLSLSLSLSFSFLALKTAPSPSSIASERVDRLLVTP